jgi:hypothetical protein
MLSVRPYRQSDRAVWDGFVRRSKNGTFLLLRDYVEYHADRFDDASILVVQGDEIVALLPANRQGGTVVSHGGLTYGGFVLGLSATVGQVLDIFEAAVGYLHGLGVAELVYKTVPHIYHRAPADEDRYALFRHGAALYRRDVLSVVDLDAGIDSQDRRRRGMRRAATAGLSVIHDAPLEAFWPILEDNLRRRHETRPVHTLAEMQLLQSRFPENITLHIAADDQAPHAGAVLYHAGPVVHAQYIAASDRGRETGALDLLFATLIERFHGQVRYFDFGSSNEDEGRYLNRGLADFKEGFGARTVCHDFYRLPIAGAPKWGAAA